MIKSPSISSKKLPNIKLYSLSIYDIEFAPQTRKSNAYLTFSIYGLDNLLIKQSPILYGSTHQSWELFVNSPNPKIFFFSQPAQATKRKSELGFAVLQMRKNHIAVYSEDKKLICQVNYEIQPKNKNSFDNNANIFDQEAADQRPLRLHNKVHHPTLDITYQRRAGYEPDSKIIELSAEEREDQYKTRKNYEDEKTVIRKVGEASRLLEQSMRKSEEERRLFSKYLDESTSYINELMSHLEQKPVLQNSNFQQISAILEEKIESDQELRTQQKWYKRKFRKSYIKEKSQLRKPKNMKQIQEGNKKINIVIFNEESAKGDIILNMFSDIAIESKEMIKQIVLSTQDKTGKKTKDLVKISKEDGNGSNSWPIQIPIPCSTSVNVRCFYDKSELVGCIGKNEEKVGQCDLFDENGNLKGIFHFKSKCVSNSVIQTQYLLPLQIPQELSDNVEKNLTHPEASLISFIAPISKKEEQSQSPSNGLYSTNRMSPIKGSSSMSTHEIGHTQLLNGEKGEQEKINSKSTDFNQQTRRKSVSPQFLPRSATNYIPTLEHRKQAEQEVNKKSALSQNKIDLNLKNLNIQQSPEQDDQKALESQRLYESQALHLNFCSPRQKKINLKITNVDVRLQQPNHNGKFLKIQVSTHPIPYYTETSKQICFLNWKGKGYLFTNIPQVSILTLSLIEQLQGNTNTIGKCKIHLNLLNAQFLGVNSYEDYLLNQNYQSIGKIIIQFEFFEKNTNDLQSLNAKLNSGRKSNKKRKQSANKTPGKQESERYKNLYSRLVESTVERGKSKIDQKNKVSNSRIKSQGIYLKNIQLHDHIFDKIKKYSSKSTVRIRKYVGGNIIIPKAPRFKASEVGAVGPGTYEYESQFQRHGIAQ